MKHLMVMGVALFLAAGLNAQEGQRAGERAASETQQIAEKPAEQRALTAAKKKRLEDQAVSAMVEEYNEAVEDDLDEVVFKKERETGSLRTIRVCKTKRELAEEEAASQHAIRMRNRFSSSPAAGERTG